MKNRKAGKYLTQIIHELKRIRSNQGLSQFQASFKAGVHRNTIQNIELKKRNISLLVLIKILFGYDEKPSEFFQRVEKKLELLEEQAEKKARKIASQKDQNKKD